MNRKKTYRTITSLIIVFVFAFTLIFTGGQNANADDSNYLNHGVRDTMSHAEKVRLVLEEDQSVTTWETESIVARMDAVQKSEIYGVRGTYRANISTMEKMLLVMEENKELTPNSISFIITEIIETPEPYHPVALGYHGPYVHGEIRTNLIDKEKAALIREEEHK